MSFATRVLQAMLAAAREEPPPPHDDTDVHLHVGDGAGAVVLRAHRLVLATVSPVFAGWFAQADADDAAARVVTIALPDFPPAAVSAALGVVYGGGMDECGDWEAAANCWDFAVRFQVGEVQKVARNRALSMLCTENSLQLLAFGLTLGDHPAIDHVADFIAEPRRFVRVIRSEEFLRANGPVLDALTIRPGRGSRVEGEEDTTVEKAWFDSLVRWLQVPTPVDCGPDGVYDDEHEQEEGDEEGRELVDEQAMDGGDTGEDEGDGVVGSPLTAAARSAAVDAAAAARTQPAIPKRLRHVDHVLDLVEFVRMTTDELSMAAEDVTACHAARFPNCLIPLLVERCSGAERAAAERAASLRDVNSAYRTAAYAKDEAERVATVARERVEALRAEMRALREALDVAAAHQARSAAAAAQAQQVQKAQKAQLQELYGGSAPPRIEHHAQEQPFLADDVLPDGRITQGVVARREVERGGAGVFDDGRAIRGSGGGGRSGSGGVSGGGSGGSNGIGSGGGSGEGSGGGSGVRSGSGSGGQNGMRSGSGSGGGSGMRSGSGSGGGSGIRSGSGSGSGGGSGIRSGRDSGQGSGGDVSAGVSGSGTRGDSGGDRSGGQLTPSGSGSGNGSGGSAHPGVMGSGEKRSRSRSASPAQEPDYGDEDEGDGTSQGNMVGDGMGSGDLGDGGESGGEPSGESWSPRPGATESGEQHVAAGEHHGGPHMRRRRRRREPGSTSRHMPADGVETGAGTRAPEGPSAAARAAIARQRAANPRVEPAFAGLTSGQPEKAPHYGAEEARMPADRGNYMGRAPPVPPRALMRPGVAAGRQTAGMQSSLPPSRRRDDHMGEQSGNTVLEARAAELLRKYPQMRGQNMDALRASLHQRPLGAGGGGNPGMTGMGSHGPPGAQYGGQRPPSGGVSGVGAYRMGSPLGGMYGQQGPSGMPAARPPPLGAGGPPSGVSRVPRRARAAPRGPEGTPPLATAR